jgi:hypothetical protein
MATLQETVRNVDVFARASPEHKLRLVKAIQVNGQVVAMTWWKSRRRSSALRVRANPRPRRPTLGRHCEERKRRSNPGERSAPYGPWIASLRSR